ncbi:MAG: hypothetical protein QF552_01765 [Litorilituus sp.]|jgi:hypothetical protein|nr:hypothetical protein [Litorilituus sp.]
MKITFLSLLLTVSFCCRAYQDDLSSKNAKAEYNAWLKQQFNEKHQKLIPIVAVADIFYACNLSRKVVASHHPFADLVNKRNKEQLAEDVMLCLGEDSMQSDVAINFGLIGCFNEQLAHLPKAEQEQKMMLVNNVILSLSLEERKKSFTQCVTEQAIDYL